MSHESTGLPTRIGSYRVLERLGEGGTGIVYAAVREDSENTVALKVIRNEAMGEDTARRFRRESEVLRQLRHPGIAAFYDAGVATLEEEGVEIRVPFLAMESVDGERVDDFVEQQGLDLAERVELLARICDALQHAHDHGVIHRDLKPANILVASRFQDRIGQPKVLDFGIARAIDNDGMTHTQTESDMVLGTLPYMSPEHVGGLIHQVDRRSDVYSMGVILFRLVTGTLPYDLREVSVPRAAEIIQYGEPLRLRKVDETLPTDLELVVSRALEKEPSRRYDSCEAFAADLRAFVQGKPVSARPIGAIRSTLKWSRSHPLFAAHSSIVFFSLIVMTVLWWQTSEAQERAEASRVMETQQARLAEEHAEAIGQEKENLLRLADRKRLQDLIQKEETLYPAHPDMVAALDEWLDRASGLVEGRQNHEAFLERLADPEGALRASLEEGPWEWWLATQRSLVEELGEFCDPVNGTLARVQARREASSTLRARSLEDYADEWDAATEEIALHPAYGGLVLEPQLGLVPLGPDPLTELWEFWHVESGECPQRDDEDRIVYTPDTGLVLVLLPGGTFDMGAQSAHPRARNFDRLADGVEGPVHPVTLSPFFLSKFELTQGQWLRVRGNNPSQRGDEDVDLCEPIDRVSWEDCASVAWRLGLELPSEAQWEYGARAGTSTPWSSGSEASSLQGFANVADQSAREHPGDRTWEFEAWTDDCCYRAKVGSYEPNAFGLHDMHGNCFEWTRDAYHPGFYGRSHNPDPVCEEDSVPLDDRSYHVLRGGAYSTGAHQVRSSARLWYVADSFRAAGVGARLSKSISR